MALAWQTELKKLLTQQHPKTAKKLIDQFANAFPHNYIDQHSPRTARDDIKFLNELSDKSPLQIHLFYDKTKALHLRLYQWQKPIPLSDILPMLENLNLRTDSEQPFKINIDKDRSMWISDFSVIYAGAAFEIDKITELFEEAFIKIYFGSAENDGFNKLILGASLSWREINIIRTYVKYLRQIRFRFTQAYIEKTLVDNASITNDLIDIFKLMHDPKRKKSAEEESNKIEHDILQALESVKSLDEDTIIRRFLILIKATLRTNYFLEKEFISVKLNSRVIPEMPLPHPLYEIFVYSPRFEAIHLRNAKVARGGIRWSDRLEDFRTEILGLMKAQVVKNAIIVPSGAKGGFVLKAIDAQASREVLQMEVHYCYKEFIRGLLDITDNIINGKIVRPKQITCYDEADPYLVVAADKGTATFSDVANAISKEYQFWLGDAFASGGATGYDHKKMGITARGAWESIKRHFRELDINPLVTDITVVGIGDMSGDVFGNGMLYSKHIRLVAAFDHRHIFLDPNPDAETSYYERQRLFNLPTSSWEDYNPALISKGGGVFKRSVKSITLTPQVKEILSIKENSLTPQDLIKAILKAPVDLLYNGGIGTYVKAKEETNNEVGDRSNDYCRINGAELRCKIVGEGGNLGFTQLGRIEYAENNGLINTDFIDNSGGVDCSDHEVNLKILLDKVVDAGSLSLSKRNLLLQQMESDVAALVLKNNYEQALVMSFSAFHAKKYMGLHIEYIRELTNLHIINREVEFLPDDKALMERRAAGLGLTRPELAVLLAYTKIHIKHELLETKIPEDPYIKKIIMSAFPQAIAKKYQDEMYKHVLHRDIIATQLSNLVVNQMGITFVYRLKVETGAKTEDILRAYYVATEIFEADQLKDVIEGLDYKIPMNAQYDMFYNIRNLISLATRWFLHSPLIEGDLEKLVTNFTARIKKLEAITPTIMSGNTKQYLDNLTEQFIKIGLSNEVAKRIATYRAIYTSLNIIDVATKNNFDLDKTARVYFLAGERLNLLWFRDQIANDIREGHWNALARLTLRDELDYAQRGLTLAIINTNPNEKNPDDLIEKWVLKNQHMMKRWDNILSLLHGSDNVDYSMFFIALKELNSLVMTSSFKN